MTEAATAGSPVQPVASLPAYLESDDAIAARLQDVSIPTLIAAAVHMTGNPALLRGPIRPRTFIPNEFQGGLEEDELAALRSEAFEVIRAYRDAGCPAPPQPDPEVVNETMSWLACEDVDPEYVPMFAEEMNISGSDPRRLDFDDISTDAKRALSVIIIGCGQSGLLAGIRLKQAGIPFAILDKNDDVGGTWLENTYPGCRVDVSNHFYCYSFEPNHAFSEHFSRQPELLRYFQDVMDRYGLRPNVQWGTEVLSAIWDDGRASWRVVTRGSNGERDELEAQVVISAVGQLNRPYIPDIPGLDTFTGPVFHTAQWDHSADLTGKRVVMIGAGASGFQVAPAIAADVGQLTVFQRSAQWMAPNPKYHQPVGEGVKWAIRHLPGYAPWYRFMLLYQSSDKALEAVRIDPDWPEMPYSASEVNAQRRKLLVAWIERNLDGDTDLLAKVLPDYPPMGKRMLQDDGSWLQCLRRENVELIRDAIVRIEPNAIVTAGGRYEADVIVLATGFRANEFLTPMSVSGRGDARLAEQWGTSPAAYLGITVPGFPNFFIMYGPGTNLAHAGSIIFHSECQMQYIGTCLHAMLRGGNRSIEVRPDAFEAYVERLRAALADTVWAHPSVRHSWYKGPDGRVHVLSPWRLVDYWRMTKSLDFSDFMFEP